MPYDLLQSNQKIYFNYKSVKQMLSKYNTIVRIFYFTLESEFHYDVRQNVYKSSSILNARIVGSNFFFSFSAGEILLTARSDSRENAWSHMRTITFRTFDPEIKHTWCHVLRQRIALCQDQRTLSL